MTRTPFVTLLLLTLPGCDAAERALAGPQDAGPSGVAVDAEPATPVADLDSDALCAAFYRTVTNQLPPETRCVPAGIIASGDAEAGAERTRCEGAVSTCARLSRLGTQAFPDLPTGPCIFTQPDAEQCDATLETLQPCLDAMADTATGQLEATFTCALAGTPDIPALELEIPNADDVDACATFTAACPDFFGRPE